MKAVIFRQFGGPEVLEIVDLPDPHAGPGQIRVAVRAVGINPTDWKLRQGLMGGQLPQTTGREVAGVVDEVGAGVTDIGAGDRVFGFSPGEVGAGAAELALHLRLRADAAVARFRRGSRAARRPRDGHSRVIGTASRANHDYLRSLGGEPVAYGEGLVERIRALAPDGVDAALDVAGNGVLPELAARCTPSRRSAR